MRSAHDSMPTCWPPDDGMCHDDYGQGRSRASYEGSGKACFYAGVGLIVTILLALAWAAVKS